MKNIRDLLIVYTLGSVGYSIIEILWRGFTHWSMVITGGLALLFIYMVNLKFCFKNLFTKCLVGSAIITTLEFFVGYIVNMKLNLGVWDYSAQPFNVLGQICPLFIFLWFLISLPILLICRILKKVFKQP